MNNQEEDWQILREELERAVSGLPFGSYLTLKMKRAEDLAVQFEVSQEAGLRVSAPSDRFLSEDQALGKHGNRLMLDLGWLPPVGNAPQAHRSPSSYYREWPHPAPYGEAVDLALGTLRSVFEAKLTDELGYETWFPGGRFRIDGLHLEAVEDAMLGPTFESSPDELRMYLAAYLSELIGRDDVDQDEQGNFVTRAGPTHIFAGVNEGEPAVAWLAAPILWGVQESLELFQMINELNLGAPAGRVIWNGRQVVIVDQFPSYVLSIVTLSHSFDRISEMAEEYTDALQGRLSGTAASSGELPEGPERVGYL